ncbi:sugar kinase [Streptomyces sp. SID10815]|uniref:sugar kinase n=1 Tax=Streptomyces sp. SID10815 TaxID=2706027 RepID=UPI0013CC2E18|nr:sugar kinase [Streptomyces sp. SID10815]
MTMSLPRQAAPPHQPPAPRRVETRRQRNRRRTITLIIIGLLIGVPAGYLLWCAHQSRSSGRDKAAKWAATGLTPTYPAKVQRRLYEVPVPHPADRLASYETNNWRTSRLYVQFRTTQAGLDTFLDAMGVKRGDLKKGAVTIGERDRQVSGWNFRGAGPWWGLSHSQKNPAPSQDVVVNLANPVLPMVYVVSRTVP